MRQASESISLEEYALEVPEVGDISNGHLCPFCGGGSSGERSLRMARIDSGVIYNCFRASCEARGIVKGTAVLRANTKGRKLGKPPKPLTLPLTFLDPQHLSMFTRKFGLDTFNITHRWRWKQVNAPSREVVFPCRDFNGRHLGHVVRDYENKRFRTFKEEPCKPLYSYYEAKQPICTGTVVIVEDDVSAAKVAQAGYHATALLGVYLSDEMSLEIAEHFTRGIVALDLDAADKTFKAHKRLSLVCDSSPLLIHKDLKYYKEHEIRQTVGELL